MALLLIPTGDLFRLLHFSAHKVPSVPALCMLSFTIADSFHRGLWIVIRIHVGRRGAQIGLNQVLFSIWTPTQKSWESLFTILSTDRSKQALIDSLKYSVTVINIVNNR